MTTGSKLVIVESPAKAKKIGGYLGEGYTVLASVGHIRDLAQPSQIPADQKAQYGKFGVDVNDGFKPYYIVGADKKKTVSELRSALKHASELYLATDEDREGEAIAWHLVQTLKPKVPETIVVHLGGGDPRVARTHAPSGRPHGRRTGDAPHPRPPVRL